MIIRLQVITTKESSKLLLTAVLGILKRNLNLFEQRNVFCRNKPIHRTFIWSQSLTSKKNVPSNDSSKLRANVKEEEKVPVSETPIINVIAPSLRETEDDKSSDIKDKVNLNNIKEQSLQDPKPILSNEPIKKIKEKILDLKKSESKPEPGKFVYLIKHCAMNIFYFHFPSNSVQ